MNRLLLTIDGNRCPFGCTYCFERFSTYKRPPTLADVELNPSLLHDVDVVYPACDTDLFARKDAAAVLTRATAFGKSISISTKAEIGPHLIYVLQEHSQTLARAGRILKVGISFSSRDSLSRLEPHTAPLEARIETLQRLRQAGIPSSITLKPILADVPVTEYIDLLCDAAPYAETLLIGGEYVDSRHPRHAGVCHVDLTIRRARWARESPVWSYRDPKQHIASISSFAEHIGFQVFHDDLSLLREMLLCHDPVVERPMEV